jgi:hypothetical protein
MARKTSSRKAPSALHNYQSRDFLLAGLGAVSLGRKQLIQAYANGFDGAIALRERTQEAVQAAASTFTDQVGELRKQAGSFSKQAAQLREKAQAKIAPAIAPVLARFGVSLPKAKPRRAVAKKRPVARRRKAA